MQLPELIELGDSDELIREIDRRCSARDWAGLVELRDRCRNAVDRGKQLSGAAAHAEYRLALEAPGEFAAIAIVAEPSRLALGPLSEVAASTHSWSELAAHIPDGPLKAVTAYECAARGEDLGGELDLAHHASTFEMPFALQSWEPEYSVADYRASEARFPAPQLKYGESVTVAPGGVNLADDRETLDALGQLVRVWTAESNGDVTTVAVDGGINELVAALEISQGSSTLVIPGLTGDPLDSRFRGNDGSVGLVTRVDFQSAVAWMAWAGASGGAQGRRSGLANGRAKAWWAVAAVAGLTEEWPADPAELGEAGESLEWFTWDVTDMSKGWGLRLAVVDPVDGVGFAIAAKDSA